VVPAGAGPMLDRARQWARAIRRDVVAVWLAARDPRVPWYAKAVALAVAAYALSPIDLIPDFIPVLGYLDDLIIVPLGILLVVKLIPAELMTEFRAEAARREGTPRSIVAALVIVTIWISAAALLVWWLWPTKAV
jgi:uncharacterized membrane protein YkvA (DUF1232 family)